MIAISAGIGVEPPDLQPSCAPPSAASGGLLESTTGDSALLFPAVDYLRSSIAKEILRKRRDSGLSQKVLAKRAGIRVETLCRIEKGKHTPSVPTIDRIDRVLAGAARPPIRNGEGSMLTDRETFVVQQLARWLHHAAFAARRSKEFRELIRDAGAETRVTYPVQDLADIDGNYEDPELLGAFAEAWDQSEKEAVDHEKELSDQGIVNVQAVVRGIGKKRPNGSRSRVIFVERRRIPQLLQSRGIHKPFVFLLDKEYRAKFEVTEDREMVQIADLLEDIVGEKLFVSDALKERDIPENKKITLRIKGREVRLLI